MTDIYTIEWLGWNNELVDGTKHDKVWGWLKIRDGRIYNFWGARGKKIRFKEHDCERKIRSLQYKKECNGYAFIDPDQYDMLVQDFISDVEIWCMTAILEDSVM